MSPSPRTSEPWIRVLRLGEHSWLGMIRNEPYLGDDQGPKRQLDVANPIGLLPCLERPRRVVLAEIEQREVELSLPPGALASRLPLDLLTQAAASTGMDYWLDLALTWLSEGELDSSDREVLESIAESTWASQSVRHQASRLLVELR